MDITAGSPAPPPPRPPAQLVKISQRQSKSCTECIRRKTRCNKQVPGCDQCLKRGIASLCRLESQYVLPTTSSPSSEIEALRQSVFGEIEGLRRRIGELEKVIGRKHAGGGSDIDDKASAGGTAEADDAATTLEFFALGMDRRLGETQTTLIQSRPPSPLAQTRARNILSEPTSLPPDSVTDALLPHHIVTAILRFHENNVYWQHGCLYFPHMWEEVQAFYGLLAENNEDNDEDEGWTKVDGAWLALFFALQAIAVHQMTEAQAVSCGLNEADRYVLPRALIAATMSSLYHAEFLSKPTIYTCQTIAILGVCGHNVCDSDLLSSLLAIGIKSAQTLNLHSLGKTKAKASKNVIEIEIGKRIWWSLTMEDWYSIPFRGVWSVHPEHFDTPIPSNCNDGDLALGNAISRAESEATIGFKSRFSSQISSILQNVFHRLRHPSSSSFIIASEAATKIRQLISTLPLPSSGQPRWTGDMRHYLTISASHKILVIYRAFLAHAHSHSLMTGERVQAQRECIRAAEDIIKEMDTQAGSQALWTIPYHCLAAGVVLALELIVAHTKKDRKEEKKRREQVEMANKALERLAPTSRIARRGLQVLADLLKESNKGGKRKRGQGGTEVEGAMEGSEGMAKMVKKIKLPDDVLLESTPASSLSPEHEPEREEVLQQPTQLLGMNNVLESPPQFSFSQDDLESFLLSLQEAIPDVGRLFDGSIGSFAGSSLP